jgi:hypothetical protein
LHELRIGGIEKVLSEISTEPFEFDVIGSKLK